jgi:glycosyltransferase involved in cell wall biosynthesis
MTIKVVHVVHWPRSGITRLVRELVEATRPEVDSQVIIFEGTEEEEHFSGAACYSLRYRDGAMAAFLRFGSLIDAVEPDILHVHSFQPLIWAVTRGLGRATVVSTIHSEYPYFTARSYRDMTKRWAHGFANRLGQVEVVCVSEGVRRAARAVLARRGARVIENGVAPVGRKATWEEKRRFRGKLGIGASDPILLALGRLSSEKGYEVLIDAFQEVAALEPNLRLVILGEGEERQNLEGKIQARGLVGRVALPGFEDRIEAAMENAKLYVISSVYEGFPMALLEAMRSGVPVISTPVGPVPRILQDGVTGFVCKDFAASSLAGKLLEALSSETSLGDISGRAKELWRERYNIERVGREYVDVYRQVLGKTDSRPLRS